MASLFGDEDLERLVCGPTFCINQSKYTYCAGKYPEMLEEVIQELKTPDFGIVSKIVLTLSYSLITLMSLIGNSLVIVTFIMDKNMRSVTNVFILSLAVADLMVTLACVPFNIGSVFSFYWIFGPFACKFVPFFMTFSVACSSLTLCSIAMDRYVAIVHPHKFKFLQNSKPAGIFLLIIWVVSMLCSTPNLVFYNLHLIQPKCTSAVDEFGKKYTCVWPDNMYKLPLEIYVNLIVLFIVPFLIMSFTYGAIGYQLWIRKPVGNRRNSLRNADMKKSVIKMLVIVELAFVLCWSPIMFLNFAEKVAPQVLLSDKTIEYMKRYFQCLSLASCCINPIIYTFMNKKFREKFATYLFCRKNRVFALNTNSIAISDVSVPAHAHRMSLSKIIPRTA